MPDTAEKNGHDRNHLSELIDAAASGAALKLEPAPHERIGWLTQFQRHKTNEKIYKAVGERAVSLAQEIAELNKLPEAELQGTVVNETLQMWGGYTYSGQSSVRDPTSFTFDFLRQLAHHCEPAAAIINTRVNQVLNYCQLPDMRRGMVRRPGFRVRMRMPKQKPTQQDMVRIEQLTQFILDCGTCEPPRDERPVNWEPGFPAYMGAIVRDRLTFDYTATRRWAADKNVDPQGKFPLVCFAAVDAAKIRKINRPFLRLDNGVAVTGDFEGQRTNTTREIEHVKVAEGTFGHGHGTWSDEFTTAELFTMVGNPISDESRNGYGYGELERAINAINIWICARQYNSSRFHKDTLPRGIMAILANVNPQMFESFKQQWSMSMTGGPTKRWSNPLIQGAAGQGAGAGIQWIPIDPSPREMEYHEFMFAVALWMHAIFAIHPEETGYQALSPFRPPLSEASPETKIKTSQDGGLEPLMRWLADLVNRHILWKLDKGRRYVFEWVGLQEGDEMADVQLWTAMLTVGLTTPRRALEERDEPIPEMLEDDPAMDLLGTYAANKTLLMQSEQQEQAKQAADMQQAQGADAQQQQNTMAQMQQMNAAADTARAGGKPPGSPGSGFGGQPEEAQEPAMQQIRKALDYPWI